MATWTVTSATREITVLIKEDEIRMWMSEIRCFRSVLEILCVPEVLAPKEWTSVRRRRTRENLWPQTLDPLNAPIQSEAILGNAGVRNLETASNSFGVFKGPNACGQRFSHVLLRLTNQNSFASEKTSGSQGTLETVLDTCFSPWFKNVVNLFWEIFRSGGMVNVFNLSERIECEQIQAMFHNCGNFRRKMIPVFYRRRPVW